MKLKLLRLFASISCLCLFVYKASECLTIFMTEETVSRDYQDVQQNHPRPHICVTFRKYVIRNVNYIQTFFSIF